MTRRAAGFTLVEVIVSLAILSLVMLTTVTGFRTLGNTATTISAMTGRTDELRSVSLFLRDAFENSVAGINHNNKRELTFGGDGSGGVPKAFFRVANGGVEWRSKILFGESYGGAYFLRLAKKGNKLVLQWQEPENKNQPDEWTSQPQRVVLENLESFDVWTRQGVAGNWVQGDVGEDLPSHVKIVLKANGKFWPELIMRVVS